MYATSRGLGAVLPPVSDWANQTVWTGTIQKGFGPNDFRFSTVGLNSGLSIPADMLPDFPSLIGHCVRLEGPWLSSGRIQVHGWAILPDGTEFTQGGATYTCGDFKPKVGAPPENPTPPVTSGGTVTTTNPIPTGVDPADVPADAPQTPSAGGASGGGYGGTGGIVPPGGGGAGILQAGGLPLIIGAGLLFALARPPKRRR